MKLHPDTASYLAQDRERPNWEQLSIAEAREVSRAIHLEFATFDPATARYRGAVTTKDGSVPGPAADVPVRLYRPPSSDDRPLPVIVFFHGGGWVIGDLDTHDELCREMAWRVPALVASVHYRRAPDHRYPAAVEDCVLATNWVVREASRFGADASRLAVAGDSAGGNLATVVARAARDAGSPKVLFQLLIYPAVDNTTRLDESASALEYGEGLELTLAAFHWFQEQYFGEDDAARNEIDASPVTVPDLKGMPPALVLVADLDPIADSVIEYADRLASAGVATQLVRFPGMMHAFVTMGHFFPSAYDAIDQSVDALSLALGTRQQRGEVPKGQSTS